MLRMIIMLTIAFLSIDAWAENSTAIKGYLIHHNALTTDVLTPEIASHYQIQRSKSQALINIAVQKTRQQHAPDARPIREHSPR